MRSVPLLVAALAGLVASTSVSAETPSVYPDAESVQPLTIGARVPKARLRSVAGAEVDLASLVAERGALLVFYRGGW